MYKYDNFEIHVLTDLYELWFSVPRIAKSTSQSLFTKLNTS